MGWGGGGLYVQHFTLNVGCAFLRPTPRAVLLLDHPTSPDLTRPHPTHARPHPTSPDPRPRGAAARLGGGCSPSPEPSLTLLGGWPIGAAAGASGASALQKYEY